jgi:N-methylhydantoinase A/oxoprolinase/acetone carboxylase beta subunit
VERVAVVGESGPVPRYDRERLAAGQRIPGPALITETVSTTWLEAGWSCRVDPVGNLLLEQT